MSTDSDREFIAGVRICVEQELKFLVGPEPEINQRWAELVFETYRAIRDAMSPQDAQRSWGLFRLDPKRALGFLRQERARFDAALIARWEQWEVEYRALVERQPRLALYYALRSLGLTRGGVDFPTGREWEVLDWVEAGEFQPLPFPDQCNVMTPEFYARLRLLRKACQGWIGRPQFRKVYLAFVPEVQISELRERHTCEERDRLLAKREEAIRYPLRLAFRYAPDEEETQQRFRELAFQTYDITASAVGSGRSARRVIQIHPAKTADAVKALLASSPPAEALLAQWHDWDTRYAELLRRHPRQGLYNAWSELPSASPWLVIDWIDSGQFEPFPFEDRNGAVKPALYSQLRSLRQQCGGWFIKADLFVEDARLGEVLATMRSEPRNNFIRRQAGVIKDALKFATGEEGVTRRLEELALETYDVILSLGYDQRSAFPFQSFGTIQLLGRLSETKKIPPTLIERWRSWESDRAALMERHPRQLLYAALSQISESHNASGCTAGYEWALLDWVESGDVEKRPFDDRYDLVTQAFYDRLRALKERCGGWFCEAVDRHEVLFVPREEWDALRAAERERRAQHERTRVSKTLQYWVLAD